MAPDYTKFKLFVYSCIGIVAVTGLYFSSLYSYLLFHTLIEFITISIAFALFMLTWNTRNYMTNNYLKLLGIGYGFIALIDLIHTFAYKGMNIFPGYGANLPTQLWIAARYFQAVTLIAALLFMERKVKNHIIFTCYTTVVLAIVFTIFSGNFPACFIDGKGLTPFKINSEYMITILLLVSLFLLYRKRKHFSNRTFILIVASIVFTVVSEISFTAYISVYGFANVVGHFAKLFAFILIYKAILVTGLREPFDLIFRDLKQAKDALLKTNETLEEKVMERTAALQKSLTERKLSEELLKKSEENFHRSISESPMGIRIVSIDGHTVYANRAFLDLYEFNSLEEFTSTPAINRYTPESYIQHQERKKKRKVGIEVYDYEISIICKNSDIRHVKVLRKELLWNGSKHYQFINLDITEQRKAEEKLRKLSIAVEQSPNAECITDSNGIIEYVNPVTIELTGYKLEELMGRKTSIFSSGEKIKQEYAELWKTIKSGNVWKGELHNKKKNGELYWESTTISPIFDDQGKITHFLAIKVDISERKRTEEALNNSQLELRKFAMHLQNVREEEKTNLAREIHDDLAQISVALKFDLGMFERKLSKGIEAITLEELLSKLNDFSDQVDNSIKSARRIINGLRPELIELLGFEEGCKSYLHDFEKTHHVSTQFKSTISNLNIDLKQSVALFRILQEALNNIIKHAKATLVMVQLTNSADKLVLQVVDNGVGFDVNHNGRQDSYGLIGMKERVFLLDGNLVITSKVGKGTSVRVEIPYIS